MEKVITEKVCNGYKHRITFDENRFYNVQICIPTSWDQDGWRTYFTTFIYENAIDKLG